MRGGVPFFNGLTAVYMMSTWYRSALEEGLTRTNFCTRFCEETLKNSLIIYPIWEGYLRNYMYYNLVVASLQGEDQVSQDKCPDTLFLSVCDESRDVLTSGRHSPSPYR